MATKTGSRTSNEPKPLSPEHRHSPVRRQLNEAFCDERGNFSIGKFILVWAQIGVLGKFMANFEQFITHWDSLAVILVFLTAPHMVVKIAAWKFGGSDVVKPARK